MEVAKEVRDVSSGTVKHAASMEVDVQRAVHPLVVPLSQGFVVTAAGQIVHLKQVQSLQLRQRSERLGDVGEFCLRQNQVGEGRRERHVVKVCHLRAA